MFGAIGKTLDAIWFIPLATQLHGDCAFDAMCFWEGCARTPLNFIRIRLELSKAFADNSADSTWQRLFVAGGELNTLLAVGAGCGAAVASNEVAVGSRSSVGTDATSGCG